MDRHEIGVSFYAEDEIEIQAAVSAPISITNGRTDTTSAIGQNYASVTFLKETLWSLLDAEGYPPTAFSFGSLIQIWTNDDDDERRTLFWGNVTDISSDTYEISFSLVSTYVYKATGFFPYNYLGSSEPSDTVTYTVLANTGGGILTNNTSAASRVNITAPAQDIRNGLSYLAGIVNQAPTQYLYVDPTIDSWVLDERPIFDGVHPRILIFNESVIADYSLDRSIEDVCNSVSVVWDGGTYSRSNQTSIDRVGTRFQEITTTIATLAEAQKFALWYLGANAPDGFPLVTIRTSAELLGYTSVQMLDFQPNQVMDFYEFNVEGFDAYGYIEQVRHTITRSKWEVEIIFSNGSYAELPQTWNQVNPATAWDDVTNTPPDVVTWDDLLYTNL